MFAAVPPVRGNRLKDSSQPDGCDCANAIDRIEATQGQETTPLLSSGGLDLFWLVRGQSSLVRCKSDSRHSRPVLATDHDDDH